MTMPPPLKFELLTHYRNEHRHVEEFRKRMLKRPSWVRELFGTILMMVEDAMAETECVDCGHMSFGEENEAILKIVSECADYSPIARERDAAIRDRDTALAIARGDAPRFVIGSTDGDGWIIMDLVEDDEDSYEYVNANLSFVCETVDKMQREFSPPTTKKKAKT